MRPTWPLLLTTLVFTCAAAAPEVRLSAKERKGCLRAESPSSGLIMMSPYGVGCLEYGPAKRMEGVWYYGREESGFVSDVKSVALIRDDMSNNPEKGSHLTFYIPSDVQKIDVGARKRACVRAIYLEFLGREAVRRYPKPLSRNVKVLRVDRVLASKFVGHVKTTVGGQRYMMCE